MKRCLLLLFLVGCRDEQAGPRPRGAPAQQALAQPSQPPTQGGQPPPGQVRSLDAIPQQVKLSFQGTGTWADGTVAYLGTMIEPAILQPGQPVRLSHFFRADKQPPQGWKFFVHIVDATSGQMVVNADHEIQQGNGPLETWPVGRIVFDQHVVQLPEYQGTLRAVLGFWKDDARLPIDQAPLEDGQQRMLGPKLELGGGPPIPEYKAPRTAKPPAIDGKLADEAWRAASEVTLTASYDGRPVSRKTSARAVLWDEQFLYVAFDCEDPDVWGTKRNKDDDIYNEDAVEVFLNASADLANYNELQVSPHNVNFDARFVSRRSDLAAAMKWESGMTTAVDVRGTLDDDSNQDQGWSAEMKIPIANLANVPRPPQTGDVWRFNLYRLEHLKRRTDIEGQSFSPLFVGDFHALPRFGKLVFE